MCEISQRVTWLSETISCIHTLFFWRFTPDMELIWTDCPKPEAFQSILIQSGNIPTILSNAVAERKIGVLTNEIGNAWLVDFETEEDTVSAIHLLGPVFHDDISQHHVRGYLDRRNISLALRNEFLSMLMHLPVISTMQFLQYGIMLHYSLTGEKITVADYHHLPKNPAPGSDETIAEKHGTWALEQKIMRIVREGNLKGLDEILKVSFTGRLGRVADGTPLREMKNLMIVYTTICCREAMRAGLPPETGYSISDYYLQGLEGCKSLAEVNTLTKIMQEDIVRRMHRIKLTSGISHSVKLLCDDINLHIEGEWNLHDIAKELGYAPYYLSQRFKKEMGCSIQEYRNRAKIELSKEYLRTTALPVCAISDMLGYSSQNYFTRVFRKHTDSTPEKYRVQFTEEQP